MSSDKTDLRSSRKRTEYGPISAAPSVGGGSGKLEPDLVWQWVKSMTASRVTAQRLGGEFPTVSPNVIQAAVAQARAELHPLLADSLTEMTELLARERIRRITRSMNGRLG
ncbi:hypothetical protein AB0M22_31880 [Nocardia sp. NPDC051756]|uniref:hypothetical protein n=1 Tax=Nocardia sp. NPDC051756 TaxID=3154751 RepID=UPI00343609FB